MSDWSKNAEKYAPEVSEPVKKAIATLLESQSLFFERIEVANWSRLDGWDRLIVKMFSQAKMLDRIRFLAMEGPAIEVDDVEIVAKARRMKTRKSEDIDQMASDLAAEIDAEIEKDLTYCEETYPNGYTYYYAPYVPITFTPISANEGVGILMRYGKKAVPKA